MRKLDGKSDWYEVQRIATGLNVVGAGAGHSPVSLSASAEAVMTVGEDDEPQEITLDVQDANKGWFGPTSGSAEVPTFRLVDTADLAAAGVMGVPSFTFATTNAEGSSASLVRCDASLAVFDATAPTAIEPDDAGAVGTAAFAARRDHEHPTACAAPTTDLHQSSANAEGTAASFARSDHWHAVNSSANPGSSASILATAADGGLQLVRLGIGTDPDTDNAVKVADDAWMGLGAAAGRLVFDATPAPDEIRLVSANLDLNGNDLVLDADGDTYLHAAGDDHAEIVLATASGQLDVNINGADDFTFTAGAFNVLVGSGIVMADDTTIGLSGGGYLTFDNQAVDEIVFKSCYVGINEDTPTGRLHITQGSPGPPGLVLECGTNGEIATLAGQSLLVGHWTEGTSTFSRRWEMDSSGNLILDDGAGDSPAIFFRGGSNDDTAVLFLADDATADDSDVVLRLCDTAGDSQFVIQDSGGNPMATVNSDGDLDAAGHAAFGAAGAVSADRVLDLDAALSAESTCYGIVDTVTLDADDEALNCEYVKATIGAAVAATSVYGINIATPALGDSASINTLAGLFVANQTGGTASYAIYSAGGASYHAGDFDFGSNVTISGTLTTGGDDPPYLLLDEQTRASVAAMVRDNVPTEKLTGAVLFYNADAGRLETWTPTTGEYRDLAGNVVHTGEPLTETNPGVTRYALNRRTGEVEGKLFADAPRGFRLRNDCDLDPVTGTVYRLDEGGMRTDEVVPAGEAVVPVAEA